MGTPQCKQCNVQKQQLDFATYSNFKSINQIEQKYRKFAQDNMVGLYSVRMQKIIEKLYTLDQIGLCNLIIKLSCSKLQEKRDRMLDDIDSIDLQQLDHLSLLEILPKNVQNQYNQASAIFYENQDLQDNPSLLKKSEVGNQYALKILHKNALKSATSKKVDNQPQRNNFFVIATVGCFDNKQVLKPLNLPTKKTALRMFLQKIEGINTKNQINIYVIFIVNPHFEQQFDKQIKSYKTQPRPHQQQDQFVQWVKFQKIIYKPIYPCVDLQRKIAVTSQQNIMFDYQGGDLIGFIMKNPRLQILLQKYQYIQIANISNLLQKIGDTHILSYMQDNIEIDIVAPVSVDEGHETVKVVKHFVEKMNLINAKITNKKSIQLLHSYYVRSILLSNKNSHFKKLISMRIKSQVISQPSIINFSRTFQQILYSPISLLLISSKNQFTNLNNVQIQYSNYCKSVLRITQTKQEQIVEICPQILFGPDSQLALIIRKLADLSSVGFPLVFSQQRIDQQKVKVKQSEK